MKNTAFSILFFLVVSATSFAQQAVQWQRSIGGSGADLAWSLRATSDGGFIAAGSTASEDGDVAGYHGGGDFWIVKIKADGNLDWQRSLGGSGVDEARDVWPTSDGGYIAVGGSYSTDGDISGNHGNDDVWVVKLNAAGQIQWQKMYGGSLYDFGYSIRQTNDGGYIFTGSSSSSDGDATTNHGDDDFWVVKLSASGAVQWQKSYGGSAYDSPLAIEPCSGGGYIVTGSAASSDGDLSSNRGGTDCWVLKIDENGAVQWQKSWGGSFGESFWSVQQTTDKGFILSGLTYSGDGDVTGYHGGQDAWVVRLDEEGNLIWQKALGGTSADNANSIRQASDGSFLFSGRTGSNNGDVSGNHGGYDYWLVQLNEDGSLRRQKTMGGTGTDIATGMTTLPDGGAVLVGWSNSNNGDVSGNHGGNDLWVVSISPVIESAEPDNALICNLFPNPATQFVRVCPEFSDEISALRIFDVRGRMVMENRQPGQTEYNISNLTDGIYFIHVQLKSGAQARAKLIVE